ncbi:MAG: hypothetical protein HOC23_13365 [Halieaceae bacterium]|nr:hypothetical protein [Halieaceae bacterium]
MNLFNLNYRRLAAFILAGLMLAACSDSSDNRVSAPAEPETPEPVEPTFTYDAEIVWTEYGIPHITAQDWGSLGYGTGYAYAQENYCLAMREIVRVNGEGARYLGDDIYSAFLHKLGFDSDLMQRLYFDQDTEHMAGLREGYAAGMNRHLQETGVEDLAEGEYGCRDAEWVREITAMDVAKLQHRSAHVNSTVEQSGFLFPSIFRATAPEPVALATPPSPQEDVLSGFDRAQYIASIAPEPPSGIGSMAIAIGGEASQNGSGIVYTNPHLPWEWHNFFIAHQTMGEQYNVMGALGIGVPIGDLGFNENVSWAHTFSRGKRFVLYELELNPANPMQYLYDGEMRDIEAVTSSAEFLNAEGQVEVMEHTFYRSHLGFILVPEGALGGWPNHWGTVLTLYMPLEENNRRPEQMLAMGQAQDIAQVKQALSTVGLAGQHTLAADRFGDAFYGDIATTPNLTQQQMDQCVRGPLANIYTDAGYPTLDGSDPACFLGSDPDTPEGILGYDNLPKLDSREYLANANQGFWMINPRQIIEGFPDFLAGRASVNDNDQLYVRPRQMFLQAEQRLAGIDDLGESGFSVDNIRELVSGSRSMQAEFLVDDLVEICRAVEDWSPYTVNETEAVEACEVLAAWDRRYLIDSVGTHIFREFNEGRVYTNRPSTNDWALYAIEFDPADPFNTPSGIIRTEEWEEAIAQSLADAVDFLVAADVPMNRPWGEIHYVEKGGVQYPLAGGGSGYLINVLQSTDWSPLPGKDYSRIYDVGYIGADTNEFHGNTYVSAVSWDETDCPDAYAVLTYSQSTDPASEHFADGTELYSNGGWIDMPFCQADIEAQELRRETVQE